MPIQARQAFVNACVILPLRPMPGQSYDGVGLALHFLLGNVMALHSTLKELWFGWRVKNIFEDTDQLSTYCRGQGTISSLKDLGKQEKVRYWVHGQYGLQSAKVALYDAQENQSLGQKNLPFSCTHHLIKFRQSFLALFHQVGLPFSEVEAQAVLWEEQISSTGLEAVGQALELFYRHAAYEPDTPMEMTRFELAVAKAPKAFMAHDLMGWALYRLKKYPEAIAAFQDALTINANGVGAMSGLMWCGVHMKDEAQARAWAARKAEACNQDVAQAEEKAMRLYRKNL